MIEVLQALRIPYVVENKAYSRDWMIRGRIRVNLAAVTDDTLNTSMTRLLPFSHFFPEMKLMRRLGSEIPLLKSRSERLAREAAAVKAMESKNADPQMNKKSSKKK